MPPFANLIALMAFASSNAKISTLLSGDFMPANPYLQRNQAVLWARDVLSRLDDCVIVVGSTLADSSVNQDGEVVVVSIEGIKLFCGTTSALQANSTQFLKHAAGKAVIQAAVPTPLQTLISASAKETHDAMSQYGHFLENSDAHLAANLSADHLAVWLHDTLVAMASSNLKLDQADTGAAKWTGAQFKPNPSMLEKFKSLLKG